MPDAARLSVTAKSMVSSAPSSARASATETVTGPRTVVEMVFDSARPSDVHTAAGVPQAAPAPSVTVTSASESGSTVRCHRSRRRSTRPAAVARPPDTATTSSRNRRPFIQLSGSLNAILNVNALSPSCSAGTSTNDAVSAAGPVSTAGPATVAEIVADSARPSDVHTAAGVRQAAPAPSVTVTSAPESGSTVTCHRSRRRSTRPAAVARPPDTATTSSRSRRPFIQPTRSLNAILNVNPLSPSCASGRPVKLAVSGGGPSSGPSTVVEMSSDSERPSAVQIAPSSSHGRPASMLTVTSPSESGSISNSHTTSRSSRPALRPPTERVSAPSGASPPTGLTDVTAPPSTSTPCAPTSCGLSSTGSLNATRSLIRFVPSWRSGGDTKRPFSDLIPGPAASLFQQRTTASSLWVQLCRPQPA